MTDEQEPLPLLGIKPVATPSKENPGAYFVEWSAGGYGAKGPLCTSPTAAIQAWNEFVRKTLYKHTQVESPKQNVEVCVVLARAEKMLDAKDARIKELEDHILQLREIMVHMLEGADSIDRDVERGCWRVILTQEFVEDLGITDLMQDQPQDPNTEVLDRATRLAGQSR